MKQLLSIDTNAKTVKGQKYGFLTGVLYLAPADSASTPELPINVCPMAELAQCKDPCLNRAGRGVFTSVQQARIAKTRMLMDPATREVFMAGMVWSVEALLRKAKRMHLTPVVRPNGTSDLRWELIPCMRNGVRYRNLMEAFPEVQWYDYTKIANRKLVQLRDQRTGKLVSHGWPKNYDLTFSYSGVPAFLPIIAKAQANPVLKRVAVVFHDRHNLPKTFRLDPTGPAHKTKALRCVDGDDSDLRHMDPRNVVVALYAKGKAKKDTSGFVVNN